MPEDYIPVFPPELKAVRGRIEKTITSKGLMHPVTIKENWATIGGREGVPPYAPLGESLISHG